MTTRPAQAVASTLCQTGSKMGSLHASAPNKIVQTCTGRSPAYWAQPASFDKWPHPYYPTTSNNSGIVASGFHAIGCMGGQFGAKTMLDVLQLNGQGSFADLGAHITAAILNAAAGMTPVLNVSQVQAMWNDCAGRGYFEPIAGVRWGPQNIVAYIRTTMPG
ncbi:MAG TPA: hypothetical protein VNE58_07715 [Casimicrobiaceae bacterium]|nr:hypothetical protein [Casimicrobiaceae bacterium]